jgi:hypothetical protein
MRRPSLLFPPHPRSAPLPSAFLYSVTMKMSRALVSSSGHTAVPSVTGDALDCCTFASRAVNERTLRRVGACFVG